MNSEHEFRFRISARTPTTMPLGRLAEYLAELDRDDIRFVHILHW
jgi:hypothetical protein